MIGMCKEMELCVGLEKFEVVNVKYHIVYEIRRQMKLFFLLLDHLFSGMRFLLSA